MPSKTSWLVAAAALVGVAEGMSALTEDDLWRSIGWVGGGVSNSCAGSFSIVGGGESNTVVSDFAVIGGGKNNKVVSNYGSILGGYGNKVSGRFGTVVGGTHNQALGRHSLAMGYYAVAKGDNSAAFGFNGDDCVVSESNAIKFCVDQLVVNGRDIVSDLQEARRLDEADTVTSARIEDLRALVAVQQEELESLSGVYDEQKALMAEIEALEATLTAKLG